MPFGLIDLRLSFRERVPTEPIQRRLANLRPALEALPAVIRKGPGSIEDQFARQATMHPNGRVENWPRTKPFGTDRPGRAGLLRQGRYMSAWLGRGAGAVTVVSGRSVSVGVSPQLLPQEVVFQASSPTRIRVTDKMRGYLRANKGVFLRQATEFLTVAPRAFRTNPTMVRRARQVALNYIVNGRAVEHQVVG